MINEYNSISEVPINEGVFRIGNRLYSGDSSGYRELLLGEAVAWPMLDPIPEDTGKYFVSIAGSDSNTGAIENPFASIQKAINVANPGETILVRGGIYKPTSQITFTKSGLKDNRINLFAYPGEIPVIDGINQPSGSRVMVLNNISWVHIKGFEIKNGAEGGIRISGASHWNILELNNIHHNGRSSQYEGKGLTLYGSSANNLILNNDSHHNRDLNLHNADGFQIATTGSGNILRDNRAWRNSDDGFDFFNIADGTTVGPVLIENCWAWENGYDDNMQPLGDGSGFKLGGNRSNTSGTSGGHTVKNCLSWNHKYMGFGENSSNRPLILYNNTAYNNEYNYGFWANRGNISILKNNISFGKLGAATAVDDTFNSWNVPVVVNSSDFKSIDSTIAIGPRLSDGSLPDSNFLKLASGSDLINKGTDVGIPFSGIKPDLGAYEFIA